jgi:NTP pyrophosphatase (non-canonical NTP hydrolase)
MQTLDQYQDWTDKFHYAPDGTVYPALALNGEAGEAAEVIKKAVRKHGKDTLAPPLTPKQIDAFVLELGDVLYYLARCARAVGYELSAVAKLNQAKLAARAKRRNR